MEYMQELCLHFSGRECPKKIYAKQQDKESRFLKIVLRHRGEPVQLPEGAQAQLRVCRPDGVYLTENCSVSDRSLIAELTDEMLEKAGTARADIVVIDGDSRLSTEEFLICIRKIPAESSGEEPEEP